MAKNLVKNDQTNEEIIEEITKGLAESALGENSSVDRDHSNRDEKLDVSPNDNGNIVDNNRDEVTTITDDSSIKTKNDDPGAENFEDTEPNNATDLPDDYVDEEALKDRELSLTEDERETLRNSARDLKVRGNRAFGEANYEEAMELYTKGLRTCPLAFPEDRSILYANRAATKINYTDDKESAVADCTRAVELNPKYARAYLRRAQLYEQTDKLDEALEDYKKILSVDPTHAEANYATRRLPPLIEERNEKLKTEMLGKLKDLGNMVLRPFGLSTENFQLKQDPNSGGYSVSFNQNPR